MPNEQPCSQTFIIGSPRSGTSWLGKVFDSNPQVIYRHEPDLVDRGVDIPVVPDDGPAPEPKAVHAYVARLATVNTLKVAGSTPVFQKANESHLRYLSRRANIIGLHAVRTILRRSPAMLAVPPGLDQRDPARWPVVIKSVSALGRVGLFADALPEARIILLLRNPLGQVASRLDGIRRGKFTSTIFDRRLLQTPEATRLGVTARTIDRASLVERLAWEWVLWNEMAFSEAAGRINVRVVLHRDLALSPLAVVQDLHRFISLAWDAATGRFVRMSTQYGGRRRYYGVFREATASLDRWQTILDAEGHAAVMRIVDRSPLRQLWPDEMFRMGHAAFMPEAGRRSRT